MHRNSELLFARHALPYLRPGQRVLELGPDGRPSTYQRLAGVGIEWETADLFQSADGAGNRLFGQGTQDDVTYVMENQYAVPVGENSFDVVVSGQVIEHVARVWAWMRELARVCRPGGYVITIGPVSWPYHEAPIDCWRIYPEGMRALSEDAGLEVLESQFACLNPRMPRRPYPGADLGTTTGAKRAVKRALGFAGWPMPVAFDVVTVARKP
jgi:SAM-dependent methyltransferase